MKLFRKSFLTLSVLACSTLAMHAGAQDHHHHASEKGNSVHQVSPTKKWTTDDILRQGMDRIRKNVLEKQAGIQKNLLTASEYRQLAALIDTDIGEIIKSCKLTPEVDSAFHSVVLADMTHGNELMRESSKLDVQRAGALAVVQSLRNYGMSFDHPGWTVDTVSIRQNKQR